MHPGFSFPDMQVKTAFLQLTTRPSVWGFRGSLATLLATKNPLWKKVGARKNDVNSLHLCCDTQLGSCGTSAVTLDFDGSRGLMLATNSAHGLAQGFRRNKTNGSGIL